jgi:hypothetical protein
MDKALEWFQSLDQDLKRKFILTNYLLHCSIGDDKREGFNFQPQSLIAPSPVVTKELPENKHFQEIKDQIEQLSSKLISNYTKGIIGENWVYDYMKEIPNCIINNVTHEKGLTDFYFEIQYPMSLQKPLIGLIECKNVEKVSNLHLEHFKVDVINAVNDDYKINFAFFVAHRATSINGIDMEIIQVPANDSNEKLGTMEDRKVILFYIYDLFNRPDRLLTALNIAKTLTTSSELPIDSIRSIIRKIDTLESDVREHKRLVNKQIALLKNTELVVRDLYKLINCPADVDNSSIGGGSEININIPIVPVQRAPQVLDDDVVVRPQFLVPEIKGPKKKVLKPKKTVEDISKLIEDTKKLINKDSELEVED